jgi:hypothetical protein
MLAPTLAPAPFALVEDPWTLLRAGRDGRSDNRTALRRDGRPQACRRARSLTAAMIIWDDRALASSFSGGIVPLVAFGSMSAQPAHEVDPDDPVEILRVLPARFHDQFLREYYGAAAGAARQVGGYRQLHDVLRLWRLTATAHSDPGFAGRLAAMREAVRTGSLEGSVPVEDAIPGWPGGREL